MMRTKVNIECNKPKVVKFGDLHIGDYFKHVDYPDIYLILSLAETSINAFNLSEQRMATFNFDDNVILLTSVNISYEI